MDFTEDHAYQDYLDEQKVECVRCGARYHQTELIDELCECCFDDMCVGYESIESVGQ